MSPSARLRYGPNRPGDATTSRPSESAPNERGSESSCNASSSVTVSGVWRREQRRALRLLLRALFLLAELHVRTEAAGEHVDRHVGLGIGAERLRAGGLLGDELERELDRELVGREIGRERSRLGLFALHVRAVAADAHDELLTGVVGADRDRADSARIDRGELLGRNEVTAGPA